MKEVCNTQKSKALLHLKKQPFLGHPVLKYGTKIGYIHNIYAMQLSYMSNWINIT